MGSHSCCWVAATSARRSSTIQTWPWSRPPARRQWVARWPAARQTFCARDPRPWREQCAIIAPTADLDLPLRGIAFAALGTAGQRCTTLRRLFVHESIYDSFVPRLKCAYASVTIGNPLESGNLVGLLIDSAVYRAMQGTLEMQKLQKARFTGANALPSRVLRMLTMSVLPWSRWPRRQDRSSTRLCIHPLRDTAISIPCSNCTTLLRRGFPLRSSPATCAKPRRSCRRVAPIAVSPTSISDHQARKSVAHLAARRKPARTRVRLRRVEGLYASRDKYDQFRSHAPTRSGGRKFDGA